MSDCARVHPSRSAPAALHRLVSCAGAFVVMSVLPLRWTSGTRTIDEESTRNGVGNVRVNHQCAQRHVSHRYTRAMRLVLVRNVSWMPRPRQTVRVD